MSMYSDSDSSPRFGSRPRPFKGFQVDAVERLDTDSGEAVVRGHRDGQHFEVHYVETSGEFRLISDSGEEVPELTRSDLRDLGPALAQYQRNVPWMDSASGQVLQAVNEAIFPTSLGDFQPRSVSDLGGAILLTGWTPREEIDIVLDTKTGRLSIIVTSNERKAPRRPLTAQEAWDLANRIYPQIEGQRVTSQRALLAMIAEATRRQTQH